ncbi:unnamed protein product [Allacma fusca]|uniref:Uncharacterized protein n=1 Tax=Allacma fusca TaxID=39272 RepID=A0A8J2JIT2_9HEXA|nr:unnamed protein product [Allacma fusca]
MWIPEKSSEETRLCNSLHSVVATDHQTGEINTAGENPRFSKNGKLDPRNFLPSEHEHFEAIRETEPRVISQCTKTLCMSR